MHEMNAVMETGINLPEPTNRLQSVCRQRLQITATTSTKKQQAI